jgi:hypothetical protein
VVDEIDWFRGSENSTWQTCTPRYISFLWLVRDDLAADVTIVLVVLCVKIEVEVLLLRNVPPAFAQSFECKTQVGRTTRAVLNVLMKSERNIKLVNDLKHFVR